MARISSFAVRSSGDYDAGANKPTEDKKDLWSSMLDGASSGKKLPQKTVLVLGTLVIMAGTAMSGDPIPCFALPPFRANAVPFQQVTYICLTVHVLTKT
jgi:hypothetical protein